MSQRSRRHRERRIRALLAEHRLRAKLLAELVVCPGIFAEGEEVVCANCQGAGVVDDLGETCSICGGTGDAREVATLAILLGETFDLDAATVAADMLEQADAARGLELQLVLQRRVDVVYGPHPRFRRTRVLGRLRWPDLPVTVTKPRGVEGVADHPLRAAELQLEVAYRGLHAADLDLELDGPDLGLVQV